jgi:hypothetical protein
MPRSWPGILLVLIVLIFMRRDVAHRPRENPPRRLPST